MQIFLRCYDGRTRVVRLAETSTVDDLAAVVQSLSGPGEWALDHAGRRLDAERSVALRTALPRDATVSARLLVRAGKGGFGSNLRAAGKQRIVDNFDACRDLDGRRIRARTAEAALRAWEAEAPQRALERVAERYAIETARRQAQEAREAAVQLDTSDFRKEARDAARAVREALAKGARGQPAPAAGPAPKRAKIAALADAWGSDEDGDEDDSAAEEQGASEASEEVKSEGEAEAAQREGAALATAAEGEGEDGAGKAEPAAAPSVEETPEAKRDTTAAVATAPSDDVAPATDAPAASAAAAQAASAATSPAAAKPLASAADAPASSSAPAAEELTDAFIRTLSSPSELAAFPPEAVKAALAQRGLKAGGTPEQRAERLFLLKGTALEKLDRKHFAKGRKA